MDDYIYHKALNTYGEDNQLLKTIEESGELITAISKYLFHKDARTRENLVDEIADVTIMCKQLSLLFKDTIENRITEKLRRLQERMR